MSGGWPGELFLGETGVLEVGLVWLVLPTLSPAGVQRESFFIEGAILLMAPALENSPNHPQSVVPCRLSLAKPLLFRGTFLWIGLFVSFGCSFVTILKHLHSVDILLPRLSWFLSLWT